MAGGIRLGTRGSRLAVIQAKSVAAALQKVHPGLAIEIVEIKTAGDRDGGSRLENLGVAVFVKELEEALRDGRIDIAVHSLKDMPSELPDGFSLAAVTQRLDYRDVLVSPQGRLEELPEGAVIGTGSLRRIIELGAARPDLRVKPIRGNADTRLGKLAAGEYDGLILAAAAMIRLGRQAEITESLPTEPFLPAAGQGALAVETRCGDDAVMKLAAAVNHAPTMRAVTAERVFLAAMGSGCHAPVAALGIVNDDKLQLAGMAGGTVSRRIMRAEAEGSAAKAEAIGLALAERLRGMGADGLIGEAGDD